MRKLLLVFAACAASAASAQDPPSAPEPRIAPAPTAPALAQTAPQPAAAPPELTRAKAEALALRNNPRITMGRLLTLAEQQTVREARAGALPLVNGDLTGEQANGNARLGYGSLSSTRLIRHAGGGVIVSQLLTDFGRTHNLVASAKLQAAARQSAEAATREEVELVVDQAFYNALEAEALLGVARQTVASRGAVATQISGLARNQLRSTLDASLAEVNLSEARLRLLDAQSVAQSAEAALDEALGLDHAQAFRLKDDPGAPPPPPPPDLDALTKAALKSRPDLQTLAAAGAAQQRLSRAQEDQNHPSLTALGTVGGDPVRNGQFYGSSWDGAVAGNLQIPIFNGFLFSSEAKETALRAQATGAQAQALRDSIVRGVRTAWLGASAAWARIAVAAELAAEADVALRLAQTRYTLGLSSIAELSQAQLAQTEAAIGSTNAGYRYRSALAALRFQTGQ